MQNIKTENVDSSYKVTPEKRALNRENQLLSFVFKATARDQEKNIIISKLHREMSETVEDYEALRIEMKIKDKMLNTKEEELMTIKAENEALKQQLQMIVQSNNKIKLKKVEKTPELDRSPKRSESMRITEPSKSPNPGLSRKRSIKKTKDSNVTNLFYNLRKKSKK